MSAIGTRGLTLVLLPTSRRIRNGVETIPSVLRRKYRVDEMPVRGKLKAKVFFGFKMLALNFTKLLLHERGLQKSRPLQVETA